MTTGTNLMTRIMLAIGGLARVRVFRNNTGLAWVGSKAIRKPGGSVLILDARPLHAGLVKGGSDLIGWTSREIRPQDVGRTVAIFTAVEAKDGKGRLDADQERFIRTVQDAGGIAGVARTEADAVTLVDEW